MTEVVSILVLSVHLICVNVASAGPMVSLWLEWRGARGCRLADRANGFLAPASVVLLVVGGVFGVLLGYLSWDDSYRAVLNQLSSRVYWGVWEIVFSLVLMGIYAAWVRASRDAGKVARLVRVLLPLLAGTNLLYHFPFLLSILSDLDGGRLVHDGVINGAAFRQMMAEGSVMARAVHFVAASFAVTGVALLAYALRLRRRDESRADGERIAQWGGRIALVPTLLQILIGVWLTTQLPANVQSRLMGGDLIASSLFGLSIVLVLGLMHQLSAIALGDTNERSLLKAILMMLIVIVLMTGTLRRSMPSAAVRQATLRPAIQQESRLHESRDDHTD